MSEIDLNELSLSELKQLQKDVTKAIASFEERRKSQARAELEEHARQLGFTLGDFAGETAARKRAAAAAKYRHPENPAVTWTGRCRKPRWVTDHLAKGGALGALAV